MMSITKDTGLQLLALLFPPACLACQRVEGVHSLPLGLCRECHRRLVLHDESPCPASAGGSSALDLLLSRWTYLPPLDAVIHGLKFGRLEFLGRDLADGLHSLLEEEQTQEIDVVVPIPLHWHRRLARGYNQAEAIANPLSKRLGRPLIRALRRARPTLPQTSLGRPARQANLRLAFAVPRTQTDKISGRRILLIDDVVTTGATLESAAESLRIAGACSVRALTAARTPVNGPRAERRVRDHAPQGRF